MGPTGRELDNSLAAAQLPRDKLFILNAMACRPKAGATEAEKAKATRCCQPLFWAQLKGFDPETPVLAMGKYAALALTGMGSGMLSTRGFIHADYQLGPPDGSTDDSDNA